MLEKFGQDRVLEPKGAVPVLAWKLDNNRELRSKEMRISLERIHLEWDNFQQICNSCSYDEIQMRAKIMDLVEKRGKLHNPFTKTAGIFCGTIEEIAEDREDKDKYKEGDRIYCIASLSGIPVYIKSIESIDYNYGQIICSGYAIIFETTLFCSIGNEFEEDYTLAAIDEAGTIAKVYEIATQVKPTCSLIIGRNVYTTALFAAALREAIGPTYKVAAIFDKGVKEELTEKQLKEVLSPLIKETYFVDVSKPIEAYEEISKKLSDFGEIQYSIVAEDITGAESLAVLLTKPYGHIYFSAVEGNYSAGAMVAESLGKVVTTYAFDQYVENYQDFTLQIISSIKPKIHQLNKIFEKNQKAKATESRARSILMGNAGREDDFIYQSPVTKSMVADIMNIAKFDCNVIIQGETGVGKEKVLSLIHQNSERQGKPCIKINCATIQESLAESEFFGYEAGAFTGAATSGKPGYFEMANNGILFLDEIGTLSMNMQSKLLRVLQENQFYRVGGTRQISVNVRVIVANNVPLTRLVTEGKFREDLYYRLNICKIEVPPLRDRRDDIICLAEAFTGNWCKKYGVEKQLSNEALNSLYNYYWPGNVRELENVVHRLIISTKEPVIGAEDVEEILNESAYGDMIVSVKKTFNRNENLDFHQLMEQQEKQIIEYALKKERTTRKAAELLGLPQTTFARKKLKYGL